MRQSLNRNDGYVLPYVLVVFLVLSFVAVSVCSTSLSHFRAQQTFVQQTQSRYEAEGLVEQAIARLEALEGSSGPDCLDASAAAETAAMDFWSKADALDEAGLSVEPDAEVDLTNNENLLTVVAVSADGTVYVTAGLEVRLTTVTEESATGGFVASAAVVTLEYVAYDISHPAAEGGSVP